ncbi:stress response transcription factor SrrA/Skn7 [Mucor ambiguus]|uniref:Transcription factor n=1 Tax=Mucor ambiguus TaxID=91626 RepID=A0A0C9MDB0_9FUNG|nr:stress response transcription factor SrrA/Skn7 [Mucor ambiguus]
MDDRHMASLPNPTAGKKSTKKSANQGTPGSNSAVPDFIQKLFRMLENQAFKDVFCWDPSGTSFLVKDTNEFSKSILPKHFKHCNFASFVRQLNKYDFHKIRSNADETQKLYGDQTWEFEHSHFRRDRKDLLEEIKRKTPGKKKKTDRQQQLQQDQLPSQTPSPTLQHKASNASSMSDIAAFQQLSKLTKSLQSQVDLLKQSQSELESTLESMSEKERIIMAELSGLQQSLLAKDELLKDCLKLQQHGNSKQADVKLEDPEIPIISSSDAVSTANASSHAWAEQPLESLLTDIFLPTPPQSSVDTASVAAAAAQLNGSSLIGSSIKTSDGLTFLALGRLSNNKSDQLEQQQQQQQQHHHLHQQQQQHLQHQHLQPQPYHHPPQPQPQSQPPQQHHVPSETSTILDKGKKKMMASWTTPPRVLLVDDDSVYRDVSGRMLNMVGCSIDLAKDGLEALQKMSVEKYDLILMDIVMPKMDGIATTRNIRRYDSLTPIVSMTSNFTHNDIMEYIGIGMNDILPKPFSKNTLYDILEKHCSHLKIIQQQQQLQQQQQEQQQQQQQQKQQQQTEQLMIPRLLDDNNLYTPTSAASTTTSATTTPTTPNTTSPTQQHHTNNSDYWQPSDNSNRKLIWSSSSPASSSSSSSVHSQTPHNKRQKLHELYDN